MNRTLGQHLTRRGGQGEFLSRIRLEKQADGFAGSRGEGVVMRSRGRGHSAGINGCAQKSVGAGGIEGIRQGRIGRLPRHPAIDQHGNAGTPESPPVANQQLVGTILENGQMLKRVARAHSPSERPTSRIHHLDFADRHIARNAHQNRKRLPCPQGQQVINCSSGRDGDRVRDGGKQLTALRPDALERSDVQVVAHLNAHGRRL